MEHARDHRPGTVNTCPQCRAVAYEPSWYASLCAIAVADEPHDVPILA